MQRIIRHKILGHMIKNQQSYVVIDFQNPSPILDYTFLQSNLQLLPFHIPPMLTGLQKNSIDSIQKYLNQAQKLQNKLNIIKNQQIKPSTLQDSDIKNLSTMFIDVKTTLQTQTQKLLHNPSITKIPQLSFLTSAFNILQFQQWNKILILISQNYKNLQIEQKDKILQIIRYHISKYSFPAIDRLNWNKFVMKQTHLQDICDFSYFIKSIEEIKLFTNQDIDFGLRFNILKNKIAIIRKISKSLNMKYYFIREQFQSIKQFLMNKFQFMNLDQLLDIYQFYTKLSLNSSNFVQKIQSSIHNMLLYHTPSTQTQKQHLVNKFLSIWKLQSRYNQNIFNTFVKPTLLYKLDNLQNNDIKLNNSSLSSSSRFLIQTAYSLLCCGIKQIQIPKRIFQLVNPDQNKKNKSYQIGTQYLKLLQNKKQKSEINDNFKQNLLQIIKQQNSPSKIKSNHQAIQYNPTQFFWQSIIRRIIPKQNIYKSKYISGFQIDILVLYKGKYFALQIQGSHYQKDSGNKKIKEQILACYGIKTIIIECNNVDVKIIMRLKNIENGESYIKKLLEDAITTSSTISIEKK